MLSIVLRLRFRLHPAEYIFVAVILVVRVGLQVHPRENNCDVHQRRRVEVPDHAPDEHHADATEGHLVKTFGLAAPFSLI